MHSPHNLNAFANNSYWQGFGNPAAGQSRSRVSRCLPSSPEMLGNREAATWPTIGKQPRLVVCWISSICRFWPFTITTLIINIWGKVSRQPGTPHKNGGSTFRLPCHHLSSMPTPSCPQFFLSGQEGLVQPPGTVNLVAKPHTHKKKQHKTPVCNTNYNAKHSNSSTHWWFQPPWKIWVRQIGSSSHLLGKIKIMFQTTIQFYQVQLPSFQPQKEPI